MALVRRSVSTTTWVAYEQVWREWEALLESVQVSAQDMEVYVLFFVGRLFGLGVSPSGMSRKLSTLTFWFKVGGKTDVT